MAPSPARATSRQQSNDLRVSVITFDEAFALLAAAARPIGQEKVPLDEAHRRVLAAPVTARVSAPPADCSAMDGYAVRDADVASLPVRLRVAGEAFAGSNSRLLLASGECLRIFTGGPVPREADRVILQEVVRREGDNAIFETASGPSRHIRTMGSDFRKGDVLLPRGTCLGPRQAIAAAAADVSEVLVYRRPRLLVLSTGDELVKPGAAHETPGRIPDSISFGVAGLAEEWGAQYVGSVTLPDRLPAMEEAAASALDRVDIVIVTGGASVGEKDFAQQMFANQAMELIFAKVAIKPGKPVWLGRADDRIVLGLPGNPTSAMVTARLFLAPLLAAMTGRDASAALRWRRLPLAHPSGRSDVRETFARGFEKDGELHLASNQDSSAQKTLAECHLLVRLLRGVEMLDAGDTVDVLEF